MALTPEGKRRRDECRARIPHSPRYQTEPTKDCDCYWCRRPRVWTAEYRAAMERDFASTTTTEGVENSAADDDERFVNERILDLRLERLNAETAERAGDR